VTASGCTAEALTAGVCAATMDRAAFKRNFMYLSLILRLSETQTRQSGVDTSDYEITEGLWHVWGGAERCVRGFGGGS
jgi:hypothetical protein